MAHQWFQEGTDVEVASTVPSSGSVFFPAKVVAPSFDDADKILVEYETVIAEEDGVSRPFQEDVSKGLLRLKPLAEAQLGFKCNDSVDAFFTGAWFEGVVVKCLKNSIYVVNLKSMTTSYKFKDSELRVHREWKRGTWFPPYEDVCKVEANDDEDLPPRVGKRRSMKPMHEFLSRGSLVEVTSDDEGLQGSWFGAIIIEKRGVNKFLIEYLSLQSETDDKFLREEVDAFHLRPHPMETTPPGAYHKDARVDAFYTDGWWEGRVEKVLPDSRYRLYFPGTGDSMTFHHLDLRPHQDWVDGQWDHISGNKQSRGTKKRIHSGETGRRTRRRP